MSKRVLLGLLSPCRGTTVGLNAHVSRLSALSQYVTPQNVNCVSMRSMWTQHALSRTRNSNRYCAQHPVTKNILNVVSATFTTSRRLAQAQPGPPKESTEVRMIKVR